MEPKHFDRKALERLLAGTGEPAAPPWLLTRIMAQLEDRRPTFPERMLQWWLRPQSVSFSPARLVVIVTVATIAFWLGTIADRDPGQHRKADFTGEPGSAMVALTDIAEADNSDNLPSLLNLGHNYLESGEYQQALTQYDKVLQAAPLEPRALYNRALAYRMLKDTGRAEQAFLSYLDVHRTGKWGRRAIEHLHELGNFTFRGYRIGAGRVVLNMTALLSPDSPARPRELKRLAGALSRAPGSELHLVVYNQGNRSAAKATATALQAQLTKYLGDEHAIPVRGSWFDVAETFTDANGSDRQLTTGLLIFTRSLEQSNRRNSI